MKSKVLIIDDEKDICFLISEILKDENYITTSANDSDSALKEFSNFNPDIIILDVWLGNSDLDGIELLKEFKKLNHHIPVIVISGHGTVECTGQHDVHHCTEGVFGEPLRGRNEITGGIIEQYIH